ncbi:MAG: (4Fe-4S)-binding protein, partial [Bacteroidia bacterium]|nr:(4Fe-4S)-binding protein [Bacteroidia bacterium]
VWKPSLCIHAAECVKALPDVYKPEEKPWIQAANADTQALQDQINKCPSGALSYYMNDQKNKIMKSNEVKAEAMKNGPLIVHCDMKVVNSDGSEVIKEGRAAFCRCGASENKPFCDGKHKQVGFEG